jgi:hypothetical protein
VKKTIDQKAGRIGTGLNRDWRYPTADELVNIMEMFGHRHPLRREGGFRQPKVDRFRKAVV